MTARLQTLGSAHARDAFLWCEREALFSVTIAGWIEEGGLDKNPRAQRAWLLGELAANRAPVGLCYVSGNGIVLPVISNPAVLCDLVSVARGSPGLFRAIVGERKIVKLLWDRLVEAGFACRMVRDQLVYVTDKKAFRPAARSLDLSVATISDLNDVVAASAEMAKEESHDDPYGRNPSLFRERILERILRHRDFIYREAEEFVFKANVSALSSVGGQLEGVYTTPARRRQGIGAAGTTFVSRWLLERAPRVVLLVNEDNRSARALYESLGYAKAGESRTIFVAP